jgi:hypothetical protein
VGPIDVFWHVLNFVAPALGVGVLAPMFAKMLWRRELQRVSWLRLSLWASASCAIVLVSGLWVFGRDGKMATYAGMVLACALALWRVGFGVRRT